MRERLVATLRKQRFDKDEKGHGSFPRGASPGSSKKDPDAHDSAGKLPGYPHGSAASGEHAYTIMDSKGNEMSHFDSREDARDAAAHAADATNGPTHIRDNTGKSGGNKDGIVEDHVPSKAPDPFNKADAMGRASQDSKEKTEWYKGTPGQPPLYASAASSPGYMGMTSRYDKLIERALASTVETGEGPASGASFDDADGDRGDVAPPAIHMPRAMSSRCEMCGKDMSVRDMKAGGNACLEHADLSSPSPHTVPRPGGGTTAPRPPMTKDANGGSAALGGPGSGPHKGGGLVAKVKEAAKEIGHNFVKQYQQPEKSAKQPVGRTPEPTSSPKRGVDYVPFEE